MKSYFLSIFIAVVAASQAIAQPFVAQEVTVLGNDGVEMGATLTVPDAGKQPVAAIVLASGSGIQNRDEEVFGKKPFKTLAEFLSKAGYAVLRVDDRGFANISDAAKSTIDTDMNDVGAAVSLMDSMFTTVPVGIIGHSYGGNSAIRHAASNDKVDFIVTLAATAWPGDSLIMSQSRTISMQATGRWEAEPLQRKLMDIAKSFLPDIPAKMALTLAMSESLGDAAKLPAVQKQIDNQVSGLLTPWYRSMLRYDPEQDIAQVKCPWLALNGAKDTQVLSQNIQTIKNLNPRVEARVIERHNHLFQPCSSGLIQEYATLPGDISDETLQIIIQWLENILSSY